MATTRKKRSRVQPTFATRRLAIRPYRKSDLKGLHALYSDAHNLRYWSVPANASIEETRRQMRWHLAYRPQWYCMWAVVEKKSRKLIGMVNYHQRMQRSKRADVGWLILPDYQGRGFMTEAMRPLLRYMIDELGLHKVEALIMPANKPSRALARKLGFRLEGGPIRDRWHVGDTWRSTLIYGLVAGEEK
jgi:ribosomal-protein-alanine N-acetyltransferase